MWLLLISFLPSALGSILGIGGPTFWPFIRTAFNSYQVIEPSFDINFQSATNGLAAIAAIAGNDSYDFAICDSFKPNDTQYQVGLQIFPMLTNTVVFQVNLPFNKNIVLNRSVLADIYMGKITNWNDSAITVTNPGLPFPNATIRVNYRADVNQINTIISTAFSSFSTSWNATYGVSGPSFPAALKNKTSFIPWTRAIPLNGAVASTPNSIGYTPYYLVARDPSLYYVHLIHKYTGQEIVCNGDTLEAAGEQVVFNELLDANYSIDSPDPKAWPIGVYIWLVVSTKPKNCENARSFFKFIRWMLRSATARDAVSSGGCGPLNNNLTTLVVDTLSKIQCDGKELGSQTNLFYSNWIETLFFVIAFLVLFMGLVLSGVHIYHFSTSSVNVTYSIIFVIGTGLTLFSPLFWFAEANQKSTCLLRLWTTILGFTILLATMFSRTWQLNDIYQLQKHGRNMDQLRFKATTNKTLIQLGVTLFGVIFTNILILIIWTATDPYSPLWIVVDDDRMTGYYTCMSNNVGPWVVIELLFFLSLLCFGIYVIYKTWSFQRQALLVETRWVLLALYNVILNICAVVPLLLFVNVEDRVLSLVAIVSIDLSGSSIICAVLLPRLLQKLELSQSGSKGKSGGSSGRKDASIRSPMSGPLSAKRREKAEISRTPEEELALRLQEPSPLHMLKNVTIDKEGNVKVDETQDELLSIPIRQRAVSEVSTEMSSTYSHVPLDRPTNNRRGIQILEESEAEEEEKERKREKEKEKEKEKQGIKKSGSPRISFPRSIKMCKADEASSEIELLKPLDESSAGNRD